VWDAHDTVRFADNVHALHLASDVHLGGASFVFADVLDAVLTDGRAPPSPPCSAPSWSSCSWSGANRHGFVTIVCGLGGTMLMLGCAAVLGLRINFLDFVALPITIGIGIEYAVNIATRERQEGPAAPARAGHHRRRRGDLLLHHHRRLRLAAPVAEPRYSLVRLAAMLGELTCLGVALFLAPALLWTTAPELARRRSEVSP